MPPPFGVAGLSRHTLIDIDEAGIQLKYANRKHGKAPIGVEVIQNGLYGHRDKFTLICAIYTTINTIHASGHDFIQRAPYNPRDGPIEYFFNMLPQELTHRMYKIKNDNDL